MSTWIHIIGGGLSGLSLASSLAIHKRLPGLVVISEPNLMQLKNKTFSFWLTEQEAPLYRPDTQHSAWSLSYGNRQIKHCGKNMNYATRCGETVLDEALNLIADHPQIELREETVSKQPSAHYCFDSRSPSVDSFKIVQSFAGLEIELEHPHNIKVVELMADLIEVEDGIQFRYLVPLSAKRLLVEYTRFVASPANLDELIALNRGWASSAFGQYNIIRIEKAHIPMGIEHTNLHWGIPIGARGGMTRDSTGYGYRTILSWCHTESKRLLRGQPPKFFNQPLITYWMDKLFLRLIEHRPDAVPNILMTLAERLSAEQFAGFMIRNSIGDSFRVLTSAPKRPFTCALIGRYSWI